MTAPGLNEPFVSATIIPRFFSSPSPQPPGLILSVTLEGDAVYRSN